jgi:hypothetical protein
MKTISDAKTMLQFRLNFLTAIGEELNCATEQLHVVEFKINKLPDEQFNKLVKRINMPNITRQALCLTMKNITNL